MRFQTASEDSAFTPMMGIPFRRQRGFTSIELVAVLAVLFLLGALLLSISTMSRSSTQSTRCLNNMRQLTAAWLMYASANGDQCVNNFGVVDAQAEVSHKTYRAWCLDNMDWSSFTSDDTNIALLRLGSLSPYAPKSATAYKCPADTFLSLAQAKAGFQSRVRSYSMSGFFGHYSAGEPGDQTFAGRNEFNSAYRQWLKVGSVAQPSVFFLFLDEHPDSINDGYYDIGNLFSPSHMLGDLPAAYHDRGAGFSFADGHSEIHRWLDKSTSIPVAGVAQPVSFSTRQGVMDSAPYQDSLWLFNHSSVKF